MRQHMFKDPPHLRDAVPGVPPELDALVYKMLAKRADGRPPMDEAAEILEELLPAVAKPGLAITGARRNKSSRARPSQPDSHPADPFAMTVGSTSGLAPPSKPPVTSGASAVVAGAPQSAGQSSLDALGSTSLAAASTSSGQQAFRSTSSQSGLTAASTSRLLPQSDGSRTDTVVALGRRPVNLIIAVALLLLLAVLSWGTLNKKRGQDPPAGKVTDPAPVHAPPAPKPQPAEPSEPAPAPLGKAGAGGEAREHAEAKHHPKHHKKNGDSGKAEEAAVSADDAAAKKAKGGKPDSAEKKWDVDGHSATP
jgi:serine/threonine-protein kinase